MINREIKIFLTALTFFTRLPCPSFYFKDEYLTSCCRYFSLVGIIVGSITYLALALAIEYFSPTTAIVFSLCVSVFVTGAFHEDGLADMADGLGGGWTLEKKLAIMKDSRIGTYGTVSLILLFIFKVSLLSEILNLTQEKIWFVLLISIHSLSRVASGSLILLMPYVQETDISKSKPVVHMNWRSFLFMAFIGIGPLILLPTQYLAALLPLAFATLFFKWFFKKQIGGITGDCLGGCQQVCELICMAAFIIISKDLIM